MDVTRDNFAELLPTITKEIETCAFMAIDEEMTGIFTSDVSDDLIDRDYEST